MMVDWIAVDWGTSNLRIWALDADGNVVAEKRSDEGMGGLEPAAAEGVLLAHIEPWINDRGGDKVMPIIACGMVGARQGWQEAPYNTAPTAPIQNAMKVKTKDARIDVRILAGIKQDTPADVMRGEETQIAGFLASRPEFEGVICLPGTHSKWVEIRGGRVMQFQTILTGELFALLSKQSVLRHSLGTWDDRSFTDTLKDTIQAPQNMFSALFSIRARGLLEGDNLGIARLSAGLIGCELAGTTHYWQNRCVVIIGTGALARLYALALQAIGQKTEDYRASDLTLNGLKSAYKEVFK